MTSNSAISVSTESNKKLKMATQDSSPSLIIGQQWSTLAELMSSSTENDEEDTDKDENKNASDSMKLGKQDMGLFGFCPARDEFSLVVCEKCNLLVKPQALKQHIESRHGPTNLSSLGNVPASALNSELGKKLLMPLPSKSLTPHPKTTSMSSTERQASGTFKPVSSGRPPTKASMRQVPTSAAKLVSAPLLGVSMKISPMKSVKSGHRIVPTTTSSSAISNPVVKVEKLEKMPAKSSKGGKQKENEESSSDISDSIGSVDSSKISTLMNGSVKSAISLTTPSTTTATTSPSLVSTPVLMAVTKTSTDTPLTTRSVTTFVTTATRTKPLMIAPVMTIASSVPVAARPVTSTKGTKVPKDQKERKFLPCKDREYDANKHCGVKVQETGKPCTRSLTCKTHALSLRRAVPGRSKSFDDLLKEHKAAKDALLKAKAESQGATSTINAATSSNRVLVSPASINSTMSSLKPQQLGPMLAQREGKSTHPASSSTAPRTAVPSRGVPTTTFAKPLTGIPAFQRISSASQLPSAITVKEDSTARPELSARLAMSPPGEVSRSDSQDGKLDQNYLPHHPKPAAICQFGGRLHDRGCVLFSRKMDYVRAAFLSALERQLNPPPHKKLCVESNLPKESQVLSNSHDPYEFNMVDTSGAAAAHSLNTNLVNAPKPTLKPKSKLPTSPVAATVANPSALSLPTTTPAISLSLSMPSPSTLCATPVAVSSVSPSGLALNWSVKSQRDGVSSRSPSVSPSPALPSMTVTNPGKRKRSGSSGGSTSSQLVAVPSGNGTLPVTPTVSAAVSTATASGATAQQQTGIAGIITPSSLNSHHSGNLIAIPSVNLANTNLGQLNAATLGSAKLNTTVSGASTGSAHKNNNINFVLTGIDSSLLNGQYVNITGAQLAELAASQGQTVLLNNFNPSGTTTATTSGTTASISITGTVPTSRPAKRSRSSGSKSHQALANSAPKLSTGGLEAFKLIPSSSVITSGGLPHNAVLMDSGSLQGAMLTTVALATGGTTPTLVAISSSTANSSSATVTGNPTQLLCADPSTSQIVSSSTLVNGLAQSSYDKSGSNSQRHHSSSKSHHHHHHHHQQQHSKTQQQQQQTGIALSSVLQASSSLAVSIPSGSTAQLCPSQALFKPGGTFNLTKGVGGKLTVQPVSLTFPISVSQALNPGKPQQLQQQQPQKQQQPAVLVATTGGAAGDVDRGAGKSDLHLQSQISSTSSNLIS